MRADEMKLFKKLTKDTPKEKKLMILDCILSALQSKNVTEEKTEKLSRDDIQVIIEILKKRSKNLSEEIEAYSSLIEGI